MMIIIDQLLYINMKKGLLLSCFESGCRKSRSPISRSSRMCFQGPLRAKKTWRGKGGGSKKRKRDYSLWKDVSSTSRVFWLFFLIPSVYK